MQIYRDIPDSYVVICSCKKGCQKACGCSKFDKFALNILNAKTAITYKYFLLRRVSVFVGCLLVYYKKTFPKNKVDIALLPFFFFVIIKSKKQLKLS